MKVIDLHEVFAWWPFDDRQLQRQITPPFLDGPEGNVNRPTTWTATQDLDDIERWFLAGRGEYESRRILTHGFSQLFGCQTLTVR